MGTVHIDTYVQTPSNRFRIFIAAAFLEHKSGDTSFSYLLVRNCPGETCGKEIRVNFGLDSAMDVVDGVCSIKLLSQHSPFSEKEAFSTLHFVFAAHRLACGKHTYKTQVFLDSTHET